MWAWSRAWSRASPYLPRNGPLRRLNFFADVVDRHVEKAPFVRVATDVVGVLLLHCRRCCCCCCAARPLPTVAVLRPLSLGCYHCYWAAAAAVCCAAAAARRRRPMMCRVLCCVLCAVCCVLCRSVAVSDCDTACVMPGAWLCAVCCVGGAPAAVWWCGVAYVISTC